MASNDRAGVVVKQPKTKAERVKVAHHCCTALQMSMPVLVDEIDDRVGHAYSGMPDRLFVIDRDGRVAYKGGRGPFGFKPGEMEQSLVLTLLDQAERPSRPTSRLPLLRDEEAWKLLPAAGKDVGKPLPAWAKTLARPLPATTAAMLRLDYLHRAASPFDAKLRGKMRWVAARANHCAYAEAYALADLRRAGVQENELKALAGDPSGWSAAERDALLFARKLTRSAHLVSDDEMAGLIKRHGEKQVVAMVLLLAYANFQDRLLLTLGLTAEPGGPLAPLDVRPSSKGQASVPAREMPPPVNTPLEDLKDPEWAEFEFSALQLRVDRQRERSGRIRVPSWEEVSRHLPAAPPRKPLKIKWSLVCMGYQPELAAAWSACTSSFGREARQDRVFEESLFWVVTRSLQCFY
jgi:alkylhydroperoxidase family enzyme